MLGGPSHLAEDRSRTSREAGLFDTVPTIRGKGAWRQRSPAHPGTGLSWITPYRTAM